MNKTNTLNENNNETNFVLNFFMYKNKNPIETIEDFTKLVKEIEAVKNYNSELFIKILIYHRITKGNGLKSIYYISMMILREEDPIMYIKILELLKEYPKDILRLGRISNFTGQINSVNKINVNFTSSSAHIQTKLHMWDKKNGDNTINITKNINISIETKLYGDLIYKSIKEILTKNYESKDINMMLFKYLSYESGHFNLETMFIWKYVEQLFSMDKEIKNILSKNLDEISDQENSDDENIDVNESIVNFIDNY